jgi:hypothetical protein
MCKYKDEKAAESDKDLNKVPKAHLPLFAVTKVTRLKSDATEFVKTQGQTNRLRIEHCAKNAMETDELRCEESAGIMPFIEALEHWAPLKTSTLEVPKNPKEAAKDIPLKWVKNYVVVMRFQIVCFDGADASSLKPSQILIIDDAVRVRVVPQSILAAKQPWLTLSLGNRRKYRDIEYLELAYDNGQGLQRQLVLKGSVKRLQSFVDCLHASLTSGLTEGEPPVHVADEVSVPELDLPDLDDLDQPDAGTTTAIIASIVGVAPHGVMPLMRMQPQSTMQGVPPQQGMTQMQGMMQQQPVMMGMQAGGQQQMMAMPQGMGMMQQPGMMGMQAGGQQQMAMPQGMGMMQQPGMMGLQAGGQQAGQQMTMEQMHALQMKQQQMQMQQQQQQQQMQMQMQMGGQNV